MCRALNGEVWGRVAEIDGCIAGCAHPLEKSALGFADASIHRLSPCEMHSQKLETVDLANTTHEPASLTPEALDDGAAQLPQ
jgi:hypothetical protein